LTNWGCYSDHMDIDDILLVDDERTYALIRKMIAFCRETFDSRKINIGSDEAFHLGRGKYTDRNGYVSKDELYLRHIKRVFDICEEYGMEVEFWADAIYDTGSTVEETQAVFDDGQMPIYWDYYKPDKDYHVEKLERLKLYAGKVKGAAGAWKWIGFAPDNAFSDRVTDSMLAAADECGVNDMLMTSWGDNGDECSLFATLPSLWYAANQVYPTDVDMDKVLYALTGYTDAEWRQCDLLNKTDVQNDDISNAVKYLLANDYLIGIMDAHMTGREGAYFEARYAEFKELAERDSDFSYIFKSYAAMCKVLIHKATYSKRIRAAYKSGDKVAMREMLEELQIIREDAKELYKLYRKFWLKENKSYGMEVEDVRIGGGIIARIETVEILLSEYLEGTIDKIYELEDEGLDFFCGRDEENKKLNPLHNMWQTAYTVNYI